MESMDPTEPASTPNEVYFLNETEWDDLSVIFDKGTLPITLSRKLPAGANIPPEIRFKCKRHKNANCRLCADHPLLEYNPQTNQIDLKHIPDEIRKNFPYGVKLSKERTPQTVFLDRVSYAKEHPDGLIEIKRMLQDFSNATRFKVCTRTTPQLTTSSIPITPGQTYHICYNSRQGLFVEEIEEIT